MHSSRKTFLSAAIALCLLCASSSGFASREAILPFDSFSLESKGAAGWGPVSVSGAQSDAGISTLQVKAFGRHFSLAVEQMKALEGFSANGVQLVYESGHERLGGRSVHVIFSRGFTSGQVAQRHVTVTESGSVSVSEQK